MYVGAWLHVSKCNFPNTHTKHRIILFSARLGHTPPIATLNLQQALP